MKAFPGMIALAAKEAGIKLPSDLENFEASEYPYWVVFSKMQLGQPMPHPGVDWENAKVVAAVPIEEITKITPEQLIVRGFSIGFSS